MPDGQLSNPTHPTPPRTEEERLDWLRLIRSHRVGAVTFHRLLAEHGTAAAALAALPAIARGAGVSDYTLCPPGVALAELRAGARIGAQFLAFGAPGYPPQLADLSDAPPVLWLQGDLGLLSRPIIALVGARNASSLGLSMARKLARELGAAGFTLVSGLARGIDAEAHRAALATGTIAVQAGGVDVAWPEENAVLAADIARQGLRLSEHPPGLGPRPRHFPQRNRIVAGLSLAVVVVEAAARSGSLITARLGLDLGREVMAVPGHPFDPRAAGCNMLIRDGAMLLRGAEDLLELIGRPELAVQAAELAQPRAPLADNSARIADHPRADLHPKAPDQPQLGHSRANPAALGPNGAPPQGPGSAKAALAAVSRLHSLILDRLGPSPSPEDQLIRDLSLPAAHVLPELLSLELEGRIRRQPGGMISRGS